MSGNRSVVIWRSVLLPASETFIRNQGDAMTRWRPTYVGMRSVPSVLSADTDVVVAPGGYVGRLTYGWLRLTGGSRRVRRELARLAPDIVHAHFGGDGWLISRSAARLGLPLVITLHGRDVTRQPMARGPRGARYRANLRRAFRRASLVIAVSEDIRTRAISLGAGPAKVVVHHTGVRIPPDPGAETPKKWDVIFVGRFVAKKGIDDLIGALGMISRRRPRALFVGAGPLEMSARQGAEALGLDATFVGMQEPAAVRGYLAESRVFAAPSKTAPDGDAEGLPTTVLEAASLGLPTVATLHGGIPEAVVPGVTGLLCDEGDRSALAANIERLLADDGLRERLGRQAWQYVADHFDIRTQTARLEALYDGIAGGAD
jgi:glycosyltransferase involved in cell wall biosynthesis